MVTLNIVKQEVRKFAFEGKEVSVTVWTVNPKIASEEVPVGTYEAINIRNGVLAIYRMKNEELGKADAQAKSKMMRLLGMIENRGDRDMKLVELSSCLACFKKYNPKGDRPRSDVLRRYMLYINPTSEVGKMFMGLMKLIETQVPGEEWSPEKEDSERWLDYTEDQRLKAKADRAAKAAKEEEKVKAKVLTLNVTEESGVVDLSTQDTIEAKKKERTEVLSAVESLDED